MIACAVATKTFHLQKGPFMSFLNFKRVVVFCIAILLTATFSAGLAMGYVKICGFDCLPNSSCTTSSQNQADFMCLGQSAGVTCGPVCVTSNATGQFCMSSMYPYAPCTEASNPTTDAPWIPCGPQYQGTCTGAPSPNQSCGFLAANGNTCIAPGCK